MMMMHQNPYTKQRHSPSVQATSLTYKAQTSCIQLTYTKYSSKKSQTFESLFWNDDVFLRLVLSFQRLATFLQVFGLSLLSIIDLSTIRAQLRRKRERMKNCRLYWSFAYHIIRRKQLIKARNNSYCHPFGCAQLSFNLSLSVCLSFCSCVFM